MLKVKVLPAQITDAEGGKVVLQAAGATQRDCCHLWLQTPVRGVGQDHLGLERPDANFRGIWWPKDKPIPDGLLKKTGGYRGFVVIPVELQPQAQPGLRATVRNLRNPDLRGDDPAHGQETGLLDGF
ncbi:hypothetical protein A3962_01150 [Meiothermus taiwanensis]|nr:hypothetical protein A3962_01150 [Meiothermus taiwanensis]